MNWEALMKEVIKGENGALRQAMDILLGLIAFLCIWLFNTVQELPEKYVLKADYKGDQAITREELRRMNEKLDKLLELQGYGGHR